MQTKPLADATDWLEKYRRLWDGNFQRLDALLDELKSTQAISKQKHRQGNHFGLKMAGYLICLAITKKG